MSERSQLWSRLTTVGMPVFRSEIRGRMIATMVLLMVLLVAMNGLNVGNNYITRDFMSALAERHARRFYVLAAELVGVFAASTTTAVFARYVEERIGLMWREWLTRMFLDRYLHDRAYRKLKGREDVDNPDQRISEDIKTFTTSSLSLLILIFNAAITIITFSSVLCTITPWLFVAAVLYAAAGSFSTVLLGRRLVALDNLQYRKEADFRYALVRVREHAGAVAQMAGERDEKAHLSTRLSALVGNFRKIISVNRNLAFFVNGYNYLTQLIPVAIVAPLYIQGKVEFGIVVQSAMAFTFTLSSFSLIVTQFQQLSSYAAVVSRLGALFLATHEEVQSAPGESVHGHLVAVSEADGHRLAYEGVTLQTPKEGRVLVKDLSLEIAEGRRLIVTGPNGAGKTALFLATAGLWERGDGRVVRPAAPHSMFLPQQPFAIAGKLRDLFRYGVSRPIDDDRLFEVIRTVGLSDVVSRAGGLDAQGDWPNVLSEGELQTLGIARLLLENPRFAFLDQAAAILDTTREEKLYAALARTDITYVSIGDHPALFKYHHLRLDLHGDGAWQMTPT